ncbi:N-acyl-phosphatidylethanolamine-hydrolyzing phospholipase D-like isoform X2 [Haliotis rubra]|nr:N-acyl-phosphatidylethanolamine-hydrolyzing phospholipase D-like isoform X2 [Haliotis rubra]
MASADNSSSERVDTPTSEGAMATADTPEDGLTRSVFRNGCYENPWPTWKDIHISNVLKFVLEKSNSNVPKKEVLDKELPVLKPDFSKFDKSPDTGVCTMWVGHATVLVQFDGVTVLTDPIFSNRCSPTQWFFGNKRYRKPPCTVEDLPKVDAVVISHNHYDHLDYNSVVALNKKFGDSLCWYVPLGLKQWMVSTGCKNVQELDWWQEVEHHAADGETVKFVCTPCQHWSKRTPTDDFKTLWGSWSVIGPRHRFFFGGDTGYCEVFKQIGHKYGPFSLAAIPIGAYEPRWFMHPQHVNPKESVQIHEDIQSRMSVGIHWGTFTLTNEPYLEPREKLKEELKEKSLDPAEFITLRHGEVTVLGKDEYLSVD